MKFVIRRHPAQSQSTTTKCMRIRVEFEWAWVVLVRCSAQWDLYLSRTRRQPRLNSCAHVCVCVYCCTLSYSKWENRTKHGKYFHTILKWVCATCASTHLTLSPNPNRRRPSTHVCHNRCRACPWLDYSHTYVRAKTYENWLQPFTHTHLKIINVTTVCRDHTPQQKPHRGVLQ